MPKTKQSAPAPSLEQRIADIHAEINGLIEAKAAELKKLPTYEGIPLERVAYDIRVKAWGCECKQYLALALKDES
jgi:hypothetical protein